MSQTLLEEIIPLLWNMETLVIKLRNSTFNYYLTLGEAFPEIQEKTGVKNYNVRLTVTFNGEGEDKEVIKSLFHHQYISINYFSRRSLKRAESCTTED